LGEALTELSREELQRQYDLAVAEYRFQVDLNWRRSEYFFVLNIGVLIAAATLLASHKVPRLLIASVFLVGLLLALLSILANETQTSYYRSARDLKKKLEGELGIARFALATTPGMGSPLRRFGKVGTFLRIMLAAIALTDLVGAALIAHDQWGQSTPHRVVVVLQAGTAPEQTVVVAHTGQVVATREPTPAGTYRSVKLEPGPYELWVASPIECRKALLVDETPVQVVVPPC
jgi:hypothetical protein